MTFPLTHAAIEDMQAINDCTVHAWIADQADRDLAMLWAAFQGEFQLYPALWRCEVVFPGSCGSLAA